MGIFNEIRDRFSNAVINKIIGAQVKEVTTVAYTVTKKDHGDIIEFNNAADITVILPNDIPEGFHFSPCKTGAGNVIISVEGTLQSEGNYTTITTQYHGISLIKKTATIWLAFGLEA